MKIMKRPCQKQIIKFFVIFTVLLVATLNCRNSYAEDFDYCNTVTSWGELYSCIDNDKDVTLADDITINHNILVGRGKNLTINLNDHKITQSENDSVLIIYGSNIAFTGPGALISTATDVPVIQVVGSRSPEETDTTTVTIGKDVVVADFYSAGFGIGEESGGYRGITIDFYGLVSGLYGFHTYSVTTELDDVPEINIYDESVIFGRNQAIRAEAAADNAEQSYQSTLRKV